VLATEGFERRFSEVVLASGDGAFTDAVVWLQSRGVMVTVVARAQSLSARLRRAARVVLFDLPPATPAASREEAA
jgi:uncharacterized LabA/DUF88 family protein